MAVFVMGSLIFPPDADPNHERFFDAHYIYIDGPESKFEAGTEDYPYTSKLTITMHSTISDPYLPIYGNKCIGLRFGTLDMHGVKRSHAWSVLEETAEKGSDRITMAENVDWGVGDQVGIASTSYDGREGEKRTITAVETSAGGKPVFVLD